jgi:hypothetical protein
MNVIEPFSVQDMFDNMKKESSTFQQFAKCWREIKSQEPKLITDFFNFIENLSAQDPTIPKKYLFYFLPLKQSVLSNLSKIKNEDDMNSNFPVLPSEKQADAHFKLTEMNNGLKQIMSYMDPKDNHQEITNLYKIVNDMLNKEVTWNEYQLIRTCYENTYMNLMKKYPNKHSLSSTNKQIIS